MILELGKMVSFCIVCMKRLKGKYMNNFWLKRSENSVTDVREGKTKEKFSLLTIENVFYYLNLFLPIKTRFLYLFLQLSKL